MKKYRSKISYVLLIFILAVLIGSALPIIGKPVWIGLFIYLGFLFFLLHLYLNTYYVIEGETLIVNCGILYTKKIDINSVQRIRETNSLLSAPALSFDRLEIQCRGTGVVISPKDKKRFIAHMIKINPGIEVQKSKGKNAI